LVADRLQWILRRRRNGGWRDVAFVSSSKDFLARCMRAKGVPPDDAKRVLDSLPETFAQTAVAGVQRAVACVKTPRGRPHKNKRSCQAT
jgi:hypothetical protein